MSILQHLSLVFLFCILFTNLSFSQTFFSCGGTGGIYSVLLVNPSAVDGNDGSLDGNCEYIFSTSIFSSFNTVVFTYVGTGTATPTSVTHIRIPITPGTITVLAPCGSLDIAFDITETSGSPICAIRNNLMPVELTYFKAERMEKSILLSWETTSEFNNLGFDIERSTNGQVWEKVAFVEGHLTTLSTQYYEFTDQTPYEGQSYYRLKQMDLDEEYEYSEIITLNYQPSLSKFDIFPNPAKKRITLPLLEDLQYENVKIAIFDSLGRLVKEDVITSNELNISDLQSGLFLLVVNVNRTRYSVRFVKQ